MKHTLLLLPLLLAACVPQPVAPPEPGPILRVDDCGSVDLQSLVGQPESVLAAMTFPQGTRIYRTGDPVTMDFRPNRLNIEIGPDDAIVAVSCG